MMQLPSADEVKQYFPYHRICRVKTFLLLVYAVIETRSCSLYQCAEKLPGPALFDSVYKRLLRFVRMTKAEQFCLGVGYLISQITATAEATYLVIDRTNWKLGSRPINLLFIGLVLGEGVYVPLLWRSLGKAGNSSQAERWALMEHFLALWPGQDDLVLLADREFIGQDWIGKLRRHQIGLLIRLRAKVYLEALALPLCTTAEEVSHVLEKRVQRRLRRRGFFQMEIELAGCRLYYIALPDHQARGHYIALLSHRADAFWAERVYAERWSVEVFFKHVKTNGFNLEGLHVRSDDRIRVLLAVVSFAYVLAVREGLQAHTTRSVPLKRSRRRDQFWPAVSCFRLGLRRLRRQATTARRFIRRISRLIQRTTNHENFVPVKKLIPESVQ